MLQYTAANDLKVFGNISFVKAYIVLSHSYWSAASQKRLSALNSLEETGKNQVQPGQECMWSAPLLSYCSVLRNP